MKTSLVAWVAMALTCIFLNSCSRARFYTANRNPIPFFREKGDVFIDGSTNIINKYDLTLGYAVNNFIGAYAGYAGSTLKGDFADTFKYSKYKYTGDMVNLGLGFYLNEAVSGGFRLEVFGDYGAGTYRNYVIEDNSKYFNGNYQRIGVMPNIGYSGENFSLGYSARFSQLTFSNSSISDSGVWSEDIKRLNSKTAYMMLEQALQFRFGFEHVKFQAQIAAYKVLDSNDKDNALPALNGSFMLGVILYLNILGDKD